MAAADSHGATAIGAFNLEVTLASTVAGGVVTGSTYTGNRNDNLVYGSAGGDTINTGAGNDYVNAGAGNDTVNLGAGNDIAQGGTGNDALNSGSGSDLLDGGAGDDTLKSGAGNSLLIGGAGNDTIRTGAGSDIVAFNRGDGHDTVFTDRVADNTLSLGGGIGMNDLSLSRNGRDLILNTGSGDDITIKNWYDGARTNNQHASFANLQVIEDAAADFNANSSDPLRHQRVQDFDFKGIVTAFDAQRALNPGLSSWALGAALLNFHLSGSDNAAIGGDLAYQYGHQGTLAGIGVQSAFDNLAAQGFGVTAQTLKPFSGLQEGLVKLV